MILMLEDSKDRVKKALQEIPSLIHKDTAKEVIKTLANLQDRLELLMLDHDLEYMVNVDSRKKNTGMEVVRWIIHNKPEIDKIIVHSLNHMAAIEMYEKLEKAGYNVKRIPFIDLDWREILL